LQQTRIAKAYGLNVDPDVRYSVWLADYFPEGLDVVLEIAPQLISFRLNWFCWNGDPTMQNNALALARKYPGQVATVVGFDEALSHLIEAGVDMFLMPSRFEPCGLNQMYSQHYGTPPIVHATGGLVDSVVDAINRLSQMKVQAGLYSTRWRRTIY